MHYRHAVWAAAALLLGAPAHSAGAQGLPIPHRPTIGVMAGVNLSKLGGDDITGADNRTGFMGGLFVTFHVTNGFAIQPEVIYSQRGASDNSDPDFDATFKLDYIDVPVLLRFEIPVVGPIRPFFLAGPSFGLQVKCGIEGSGGGVSASVDCDQIGDQVGLQFEKKTFDLSGVVGAGLDFHLGGHTLMLGARYQHGFSDVMKDATVKNRTWSVVAGLGF